MKFLVFGSLNIDMVYRVDHIAAPGETITVRDFSSHSGGKGANQAAALGKAGMPVWMAGKVGADADGLLAELASCGTDVSLVGRDGGATGHALIQLAADGENAICVYPGANRRIDDGDVRAALSGFGSGDVLVLQNEINQLDAIMRLAAERGMRIAFNPAPFDEKVMELPLELLSVLIVNSVEAGQMTGLGPDCEAEPLLAALESRFPGCEIILTLGGRGAAYAGNGRHFFAPAEKVNPVDTTGAGDTFIGYFLALWAQGKPPEDCLRYGCRAAALAVARLGAMNAIPRFSELA